ncbi:hypothetical protein MEN41_03390 [Dolichospermum sp. ST_con]|nr:hypothetical protein [Dolichospermum sp. ST_con]MDD1418143.1 hypothetical protein [Dolichospermum sp. ST_sed1]MDD1431865.1 hypothetical protein [Dolichospermum sp. ST_sed6]MDD1435765.1 hypothetical protein [Dolichospermum sp. ST_sed10]MDD1441195.1 hypothetical protein [Dolichospermum sp. ST_sed3]MDD1446707.1 hypothetical protein [Dolichospermum sp. ST_sed8]MDD1455298.1 hypothetical protein [Dolichospermum sp. ST_sed7]MDD1461177.1 hypothetical protein [Dolichospermum sp. ST_sed2]MDD146627
MKCIKCGTDNNLKDRTANQGRCTKCNHPFAFEPTTMGTVKITDPMFAKVINDISANNTLFFTPKQLLYFLDSRLRKKSSQQLVFGCLYLFFNIWGTLFFGGMLSSTFGSNSFLIANAIYQISVVIYLFNNTNSAKLNSASRKASAKSLQRLGVLILVVGILISLFVFQSFILFVVVTSIGTSSLFLGTRQLGKVGKLTQEFLISQTQLQEWLNRWKQINNVPEKILPSPKEQIAPALINPDVTAYSFDRLVVCDSATIAQLLIANNFHFENNCAILSITGYPESIFNTTMEMLRRNPDLKVYAIHDCTPKGVSLVNHLRTSERWFLNSNVKIIDIGLLPRQIMATQRGMFIQSSPDLATAAKQLSREIRQNFTSEELAWLDAGNFVELESFTPQILIQVIRSGISGSSNLESDDSSMILMDNSGNDIYMVESFG